MLQPASTRSPLPAAVFPPLADSSPHNHNPMASYCPTPSRAFHGALGISLGICCMAKKVQQPTMQAFIQKFREDGFDVVIFEEAMVMGQPASAWPVVDCAIMFQSKGFPLTKACEYHDLNPDTFFLTDPASQRVLLDRRDFYTAMTRNNIPCSKHVFCNRDGYRGSPNSQVIEGLDYIIVDGVRMDKPFVEKPCDSDDHDVFIYYPSSGRGGCTQLFRKNKNQSSIFVPDCTQVRREGSYVYEGFVSAKDGIDIKCYTAGPDYVHAEARKAPCVDGVVERDDKGKERRIEVILTPDEMMAARKLTKAFRQMVCGFDLLRGPNGQFFILDVNGWSFVKNNDGYVARASEIMKGIFIQEHAKRGLHRMIRQTNTPRTLCGVVGVFRHGDRTPKQKVKIVLKEQASELLDAAFRDASNLRDEAVFKGAHLRLQEIERIIQRLLSQAGYEMKSGSGSAGSTPVLSAQVTPGTMDAPANTTMPLPATTSVALAAPIVSAGASAQTDMKILPDDMVKALRLMYNVLQRRHEGLKMQFKPVTSESGKVTSAQVVCKWGGWLTEAGHHQAVMLGRRVAEKVLSCKERGYTGLQNAYVAVNNERRVMHTAISFMHQFNPDLEPVVEETLLGDNSHAKALNNAADHMLSKILHDDGDMRHHLDFPGMMDILRCPALNDDERTPKRVLMAVHRHIRNIVDHIPAQAHLYRDEPIELMRQRWVNLLKSFYDTKEDTFDITKITDVFDYVSYDVCYNQVALAPLDMYPLFTIAELLSAFVSDHECGFSRQEKSLCGSLVAGPLLLRIFENLLRIVREVRVPSDPTVFLYFTSESHVNGLRHILYNSDITTFHPVGNPLELHFLSHFLFKIYRYAGQDADSPPSHQIEVHFSTGIDKNMFGIVDDHHTVEAAVSPMIRIHNNMDLRSMFKMVKHTIGQFNREPRGDSALGHQPRLVGRLDLGRHDAHDGKSEY